MRTSTSLNSLKAIVRLASVVLLLTIGIGNVWGATYTGTFTKITSTEDFTTGYYVICGAAEATANNTNRGNFAMGSTITSSSSNRQVEAVSVSIVGGTTITNPDNTIVYYITVSGTTCTFMNVNTNKYLYQTATGNNRRMGFKDASSDITLLGYQSSGTTTGFKFTFNLGPKANDTLEYSCSYNNPNYTQFFANYKGAFATNQTPLRLFKLAASCSTNATVEAGSNSSVTSTTATVTCASGISSLGSAGCSIESYGFVLNTTGSPTISDTKHQVGTTYTSTGTSFSKDLTDLTPNTTYYVRPYATNGNGTAYGTQTSFTTLQRYAITYNSNGGSGTIASAYKDHGISFTLSNGSGFSKTGYTLSQWRLGNASTGDIYAKSGSYTTNAAGTFYAQWTANQYTITLDQNGATTDGTTSVDATYNSSSLSASITNPKKTHYIFNGWYSGSGGTGTLIIDEDGVIQASTSYTDASGNWTNTSAVTLYAKWTEHTYTNYRTSCCTELGTIDGEASLTQAGNSVTIYGWSDVSNVGTYTVKLYKKNGASWDLVSGTASGGSAGAQGTRTGITSGSKSVTYTGLEVESEYKFTVQAIAGSAAYCDGAETAVTEINDVDVSSTPFKFRYAIYIDDGTNDNYEYYYIEPTGNTDEGSVTIDLNAHVDYYQFKIAGGFSGWWGQTGTSKIPASTEWELDGSNNVRLESGAGGSYTFTVDYSSMNPAVTVTFPSADQDAGYVIYYDNSVLNWSSLYYRVGNNSSCSKVDVSLVPGTDKFYKVTTPDFDNMDAWHLANNYGWTGSNSIYRTKTSSDPAESPKAITNSIAFQQYAVTEDITVIPTSTHSTGSDTGDAGNSNCEFYTINTPTSGMLTHNAAITSYSHGTVTVAYTNTSGSAASFTSGNADLAHRCVLTITATPATGYSLSSLQVNSSNFTSGNEHILTADATITAVFTAQTSTVTLQATSATTGSDQTVLATYDASMPLVTTADKTPAVAAISRTGYTFNGWWDATSGGKQYYSHSAGTIVSANNWDKTGTQTLYAQWIAKEYTITLDREGGSTGAESVTATFDSGTLTGWSAPTKTGYRFDGYYSGDNGTGTLVISSTGVLQNSVTISAVNWTDASGHWIKDGGVTVYAKWTANEYTISYKDEGNVDYSGSNGALLPTTHTYGAATDLVDGVKSGYRFDGWFDNSSCTGSAITTIGATAITANTTYYAKWTVVYTVTWHVNGSTYETGVVTGNSQVPDGEKISDVPTAPADNTLNNCANKFMGWSSKNATSTPKTTSYYDDLFTDVEGSPEITDDTEFYAVFAERNGAAVNTVVWSENWTGVTSGKKPSEYDGTGRTIYNGGTVTYTESGSNCNIAANSYAGGSSPELYIKGGEWWNIANIPTGGATTLTLTYMSNNDADVTTTTGKVAVGTTSSSGNARTRTITISGDVSNFDLKFAKSSNTRVDNVSVKVATSSYTDYVTECASTQVRVTYDFNGGSGTACSEGVTTTTASYTVCTTTPTKDYYDFAGWNDGTSTYNAGSTGYNLASSTTFTAQWTPTTYDITYELDGGTNSGSNPATYNVETSTITLQDPSKGRDRFDGWYDNSSFTGDAVTSIPVGSHGDITLYAKWAERHHIEFFKEGVSVGEIWRADDENLEDAVAGMGSVPDDPDAPSACSSKVFVGWSESEIADETDTKPSDLMKSAVGTVDEDKEFHAVWAIVTPTDPPATYAGTGVFEEITSMEDFETGTYYVLYGYDGESTHGALKNAGSGTAGEEAGTNMTVSTSSITNPSTDIVWKLGGTTDAYTLYNQSASKYIEITANDAKGYALNASATSSFKVTVEDGHGFFFKSNHASGGSRGISIYTSTSFRCYALASAKNLRLFKLPTNTVTAYCTSCCATNVTLSENSPEHGTIVFGKTSVGTCGGDKEVSLTITPEAGYQLHSYVVATGSGKVATKSVSPDIALDNNSSVAQNITLTFAEDANGAYDVTASFSLMTVTSWAWTLNSAAIPDPLNLYVGQSARLDVAYTPAGVDASKKTYTRNKDNAYINWVGLAYAGYSTISGKASTGENTTPVTFTHADGPSTTVNVKVLPLPLTHFVDLVHGKSFDDVEATLETNVLSATKTTPTSDDWTTPNANTCEENHLHLVGWIREDWPALVAYLNGTGDAPATTAIVGAGNDGSGNAYFIAAGASINVQTFDGVTFYAVWAEIK